MEEAHRRPLPLHPEASRVRLDRELPTEMVKLAGCANFKGKTFLSEVFLSAYGQRIRQIIKGIFNRIF